MFMKNKVEILRNKNLLVCNEIVRFHCGELSCLKKQGLLCHSVSYKCWNKIDLDRVQLVMCSGERKRAGTTWSATNREVHWILCSYTWTKMQAR